MLPLAQWAYNVSRNSSIGISPFRALYGYNPNLYIDLAVADNGLRGEVPAARDRVAKLYELRQRLRDKLQQAQEAQAKYYNQRHKPMEFRRGDIVKLSTRNLRLKNKKLQPRWIGPFRVTERIGSQAYRLALPEAYQALHDVFPIQLLEKYHPREGEPPLPMPELEEDNGEWEIEEVRNTAKKDGQVRWLVKWKGWPSEYNQ